MLKKRRQIKDILINLLDSPSSSSFNDYIKEFCPYVPKEDMTNSLAVAVSVIKKAIDSGDIKAAEFIRDTIGEKPTEKSEISTSHPLFAVVPQEQVLEDWLKSQDEKS